MAKPGPSSAFMRLGKTVFQKEGHFLPWLYPVASEPESNRAGAASKVENLGEEEPRARKPEISGFWP